MNDPEVLTPEEAAEILGVSREASVPQVERAYAEKLEALEKKIAQAPTAALKNKYRVAMDRLKNAREALEKQDDGCDLPSLEVSEAPAPVSVSIPLPEPSAAPTPAVAKPKAAPKSPKKPLPVKAISIGLAALLLIALAVLLLRDPATAIYAGDYRVRRSFDTSVYDYVLSVQKNGEIAGTNQLADQSSKPVKITGAVDKNGVVSAKGDDQSIFVGQIKGEKMELKEQIGDDDPLSVILTRGLELPKEAPQAEWAGVYHNPSIEYPAGKYEMRFEVAKNGDVKGFSRKLTNEAGSDFNGRVSTKGKVTATWDLSDGSKVEYTGSVAEDEMILKETLASGTVFNIKLSKGEKESITLSPYAGVYRDRIKFSYGVYDYEMQTSEDGEVKGSYQIAGSGKPITVTGTVNDEGEFKAAASDNKVTFTGTINDGEMAIKEKFNGKDSGSFTLIKDKKSRTDMPQAAFAGTYLVRGASVETRFHISDKGELTITKIRTEDNWEWLRLTGTVDTVGKFSVEGTSKENPPRVLSYEGAVIGSEIKTTDKVVGTDSVFNITLPKI
jgi:hypothetical protein